jgi:hypothetical protein
MELRQHDGGWHPAFQDGSVQLIQIDFRLELFLNDPPEMATLYVETPCRLRGPCINTVLTPDTPSTLAPALFLFNSKVIALDTGAKGNRRIEFGGPYCLEVDSTDAHEAWQVGSPTNGFLLVCSLGGEVSFFLRGERNSANASLGLVGNARKPD